MCCIRLARNNVKGGEFLYQLSDCWLVKEDCVPWVGTSSALPCSRWCPLHAAHEGVSYVAVRSLCAASSSDGLVRGSNGVCVGGGGIGVEVNLVNNCL